MAKNAVYIITLSLVSIILTSTPNLALAAPAIHSDGTCQITLPDGETVDAASKIVVSKSGEKIKITCHGTIENYSQGLSLTNGKKDGTNCMYSLDGIGIIGTENWTQVITPNGQFTQTCHFEVSLV